MKEPVSMRKSKGSHEVREMMSIDYIRKEFDISYKDISKALEVSIPTARRYNFMKKTLSLEDLSKIQKVLRWQSDNFKEYVNNIIESYFNN